MVEADLRIRRGGNLYAALANGLVAAQIRSPGRHVPTGGNRAQSARPTMMVGVMSVKFGTSA